MGNESKKGQQSRHDAPASEAVDPVPSIDFVVALQRQVDALSVRVTGQACKYKRIEKAEKRVEKGWGKSPVENNRCRSPEPKRRRSLDRIGVPDRAYSRAYFPRGSDFSRLQGDSRKREEVNEGKIEYLIPMKTSIGNVFLEIEDKQLLMWPPL
ncbi:hypothetical protein LIER_41628 [Lithospermum erythrorhizon]|uniref:Uncharacterized protein n=1 Tax=Lithospermum erythrorhizon TaxID=34254 RepID=A0AAV3RDR6_LITER